MVEIFTISLNFNHKVKDKVKRSPKLNKDVYPSQLMLKFLPTHVFNAIKEFNKIVRLELPFVTCGRTVQEAKCPGSPPEGICGHICNSISFLVFHQHQCGFPGH